MSTGINILKATLVHGIFFFSKKIPGVGVHRDCVCVCRGTYVCSRLRKLLVTRGKAGKCGS